MAVSRNRAHFYVYCSKVGTLWSFTDYWPFVDYEVQPFWLMGWWATGKLANEQYKGYLLKCKKSFRVLLQNYEAVVQAEETRRLEQYRVAVARQLAETRLPFRAHDDPILGLSINFCAMTFFCFFQTKVCSKANDRRFFPKLPIFLDQFRWAKDRYSIYALQGQSQAAKTSFVKSLFSRPFVVTIQGQDSLNLQKFQYGHHDALILDNLVEWSLILKHRALLQSNTDVHILGESTTGVYAYRVFLWAIPVCITLDADVQRAPFDSSEWLQANVLLDVLPLGAKCFSAGQRQQIRMSDMPRLQDMGA